MKKQILLCMAVFLFVAAGKAMPVRAANDTYVTITVDATDDSGSLQYAIDSDAPEAFSDRGSFQVAPGSTHTIYVKDSAGNVTAQEYSVPPDEHEEEQPEPSPVRTDASVNETYGAGDERKVNIDVNLSNGAFTASGAGSAAEGGGGTLYDKEKTDGTDVTGKVFYTVTTKEGEVFYLVVDQNRSDNNVYLLTQATVNDLQYLADQNDYNFTIASTGQGSQSLLNMLSGSSSQGQETDLTQQPGEQSAPVKSKTNSTLPLVVLAVIAGGGYYIFRTRRNRREKQMDEIDSANDLQDYEIEDDPDDDELEFGEAPVEQEWDQEDEELKELMELNTEDVFGEEGESGSGSDDKAVPPVPTGAEMGLDYDEFGEEE